MGLENRLSLVVTSATRILALTGHPPGILPVSCGEQAVNACHGWLEQPGGGLARHGQRRGWRLLLWVSQSETDASASLFRAR